jgi:recombination protein RecR
MNDGPFDQLIRSFSKLPGLGPRSARRIALHLLTNKQKIMAPLMQALEQTAQSVKTCHSCGNLDLTDPCSICQDERREQTNICVVAGISDLWAIERTGAYKGRYHILGGVLSALDGIGPNELSIEALLRRLEDEQFEEIIIALSATVDGQATAHYITDKLPATLKARVTRLAHGVPMGGELDYLDDGTITTALKSRSQV